MSNKLTSQVIFDMVFLGKGGHPVNVLEKLLLHWNAPSPSAPKTNLLGFDIEGKDMDRFCLYS